MACATQSAVFCIIYQVCSHGEIGSGTYDRSELVLLPTGQCG